MRQISVRELRQNASVWLREVRGGASFEVTDRGTPIAVLGPLSVGGHIERMIVSGRVRPPIRKPRDHGPPIEPIPGLPLPSEVLERDRADER